MAFATFGEKHPPNKPRKKLPKPFFFFTTLPLEVSGAPGLFERLLFRLLGFALVVVDVVFVASLSFFSLIVFVKVVAAVLVFLLSFCSFAPASSAAGLGGGGIAERESFQLGKAGERSSSSASPGTRARCCRQMEAVERDLRGSDGVEAKKNERRGGQGRSSAGVFLQHLTREAQFSLFRDHTPRIVHRTRIFLDIQKAT